MKPLKLYEQFVFEEAIKNANEITSKLTGYKIINGVSTSLVKLLTLGRVYIELDTQKAITLGGQVAAFTYANSPILASNLMSLTGAKKAPNPEGQIKEADGTIVNYYNWTMYTPATNKTEDMLKLIADLETILTKGELPTEKTQTSKSAGEYLEGDMVFLKNTGESVKIVGYVPAEKSYLVRKITDAENSAPRKVLKDQIDRKDYAASLLGSEFITAYRSALASVYGGSGGLDTSKEKEKAELGIGPEVNNKFMVDPEGAKIVKELEALTKRAKAENRSIDSYPENAQLNARAKIVQDRIIADVIKSKPKA